MHIWTYLKVSHMQQIRARSPYVSTAVHGAVVWACSREQLPHAPAVPVAQRGIVICSGICAGMYGDAGWSATRGVPTEYIGAIAG